jgi:hypothetical protein
VKVTKEGGFVQVGDLVKLVRLSTKGLIGIVIDNPRRLHGEDRFDILMQDGTMVKGLPRPYMELISESR